MSVVVTSILGIVGFARASCLHNHEQGHIRLLSDSTFRSQDLAEVEDSPPARSAERIAADAHEVVGNGEPTRLEIV